MNTQVAHSTQVVLRSGVPGHQRATRKDLDIIIGSAPITSERGGYAGKADEAAALCWSLAHTGRLQRALAIADRQAMPLLSSAASTASDLAQSDGYAALGEVFLLDGRVAEAANCARSSAEYAEKADAHRFRATSLLAAAQSLNGEFVEATRTVALARHIDGDRGWSLSSWPLALASTQLSFRSEAIAESDRALDDLARAPGAGPIELVVARLGRAWLEVARGDYRGAMVHAKALTHGTNAHQTPRFLLDLALSAEALALAHLGQPGAVLALVGHRPSPPTHAVCFQLHRATVYLQLGEPRKALAATVACVRNCPDHCLRTYPSVLIRRAAAHELLGHEALADADYSLAAHLGTQLGGVRPVLGVPLDIIERLHNRLLENEPLIRERLAKRIPETGTYPNPKALDFELPPLTKREQALARWLVTDLTMASIAAKLSVSPNTVKTQTRSLYRKLGVDSRAAAVSRLEQTGLSFDEPGAE